MSLWTETLGGELRFVSAAGVRTRCLRLGDGADLVLLHGRGGHLETFARNVGPLSKRYRVCAFDLAGHGLSEPMSGDYTVGRLAEHVDAVLEALGIERAHFVGQSLGGWIAAWLAITRPGRVERLILIEPAGLLSEKERLADPRIAAAYAAGGEAFENPSREAVAKRLKGLLADPDAIDPEILEIRWRLYQPPQARAVHKNVRRADNDAFLLRPDVLGRLRAPTLFVRGSLGNTPLQIVEEAVRACPQARLETIEGVRQWPQFEAASRVNAVIREFLG